jgi:hypothetical protein
MACAPDCGKMRRVIDPHRARVECARRTVHKNNSIISKAPFAGSVYSKKQVVPPLGGMVVA